MQTLHYTTFGREFLIMTSTVQSIDVWEADRKYLGRKTCFERAEQLWIKATEWIDRNIFNFYRIDSDFKDFKE